MPTMIRCPGGSLCRHCVQVVRDMYFSGKLVERGLSKAQRTVDISQLFYQQDLSLLAPSRSSDVYSGDIKARAALKLK